MSKFLKKILGKDKSNGKSFDSIVKQAKEWETQQKAAREPAGPAASSTASMEETMKRGGFDSEPSAGSVATTAAPPEQPSVAASGVEQQVASGGSSAEAAGVPEPVSEPAAAEQPAPEIYVVQSGDSLSAVAQRLYGDAGQYMRIFEANRDKISDPNLIHPGQELSIPR